MVSFAVSDWQKRGKSSFATGLVVCVCLFAMLTLLPVRLLAAETLRLNQSVMVTENYVRLGDIFLGLQDSLSGTPVMASPAIGGQKVLSTAEIAGLARKYKLDWAPTSRHQNVTISRMDQLITPEMLVNRLEAALRSSGVDGNLQIELDGRPKAIRIPSGEGATIGVESLQYEQETGRFYSVMVAATRKGIVERATLNGHAFSMVAIPVLSRRLGPDDVIRDQDLEWKKVRADKVDDNFIMDMEQLVGRSPMRWTRAGEAFKRGEVQAAIVVRRGTLVSMVLRSPNMTLTTQGKALDDGAMGEAIRVLNTSTNRTVYATVIRPDVVSVKLADMHELSN